MPKTCPRLQVSMKSTSFSKAWPGWTVYRPANTERLLGQSMILGKTYKHPVTKFLKPEELEADLETKEKVSAGRASPLVSWENEQE